MKKAVLLTLGMLLLSSLIFSLAILLFHNTQGTESRFAELSLYDRLYDLDSSVQRGFKEIFTRNSYMGLTLSDPVDNIVFITETLPHGSTNNFVAETEAYSNYLKEMYPTDPKITINNDVLTEIKTELPVYVMPQGIKISHNPAFLSGDLEITPLNSNDIKNYSISLTTEKRSVTFDNSGLKIKSDGFPLRVSVTTSSGTSEYKDKIDLTQSNNNLKLNFDTDSPTQAIIEIDIDNTAHLLINRGSVTVTHNIEIALNPLAEQMVYAKYPDNFFKIDFPGENLKKTGTVRIA